MINESHDSQVDLSATAQFGAVSTGSLEPIWRSRGLNAEEVAAVSSLPEDSALLIALRGPNQGARFLLASDVTTVGRRTKADIFLDDVTVSRRHAEFIRNDQGFLVRDLGSLNGTYVNKELVDSRQIVDGDEVQIGKFRLTYHQSALRNGLG